MKAMTTKSQKGVKLTHSNKHDAKADKESPSGANREEKHNDTVPVMLGRAHQPQCPHNQP